MITRGPKNVLYTSTGAIIYVHFEVLSTFGHQIINLSFLNLKPNFNATVLRTQEIVVGN